MEPGFRNLGFRALSLDLVAPKISNKIAFHDMDWPGFKALPGIRTLNHGNRDWFLKLRSHCTCFEKCERYIHNVAYYSRLRNTIKGFKVKTRGKPTFKQPLGESERGLSTRKGLNITSQGQQFKMVPPVLGSRLQCAILVKRTSKSHLIIIF